MTLPKPMTVTCWYEDEGGAEHPVEVTLVREDLSHRGVVVETDLSGLPEGEEAGVRARALDLFLEREAQSYAEPPEDR